MSGGQNIINLVAQQQDLDHYRKTSWNGSFQEYLDLVKQHPMITRNAFQRVYDMIMDAGVDIDEEVRDQRKVHYRFFDDPYDHGRDAVYGLDESLEAFVNALQSAAHGYGTEKRVLLLHGPVGSSKSTIAV